MGQASVIRFTYEHVDFSYVRPISQLSGPITGGRIEEKDIQVGGARRTNAHSRHTGHVLLWLRLLQYRRRHRHHVRVRRRPSPPLAAASDDAAGAGRSVRRPPSSHKGPSPRACTPSLTPSTPTPTADNAAPDGRSVGRGRLTQWRQRETQKRKSPAAFVRPFVHSYVRSFVRCSAVRGRKEVPNERKHLLKRRKKERKLAACSVRKNQRYECERNG